MFSQVLIENLKHRVDMNICMLSSLANEPQPNNSKDCLVVKYTYIHERVTFLTI